MKKLNNTKYNVTNLIYLTKFYLSNKDVGSLNFFYTNLKNISQVKKSQGYIYSLFPALQIYTETPSSINSTGLISLGIALGSVLYYGFKFLFKNKPINEPEIVSEVIHISEENTALFIAKNFHTWDCKVFPTYNFNNLRPGVYFNSDKTLGIIQPTLHGNPKTITFENAQSFIDVYSFKINNFIGLLDSATIF